MSEQRFTLEIAHLGIAEWPIRETFATRHEAELAANATFQIELTAIEAGIESAVESMTISDAETGEAWVATEDGMGEMLTWEQTT